MTFTITSISTNKKQKNDVSHNQAYAAWLTTPSAFSTGTHQRPIKQFIHKKKEESQRSVAMCFNHPNTMSRSFVLMAYTDISDAFDIRSR